jgi:hypothetical protein
VSVCLYVEGGGPNRSGPSAIACRKAFHVFLEKVFGDKPRPRIIASGSRDKAYDDFSKALDDPDSFAVLLVDSEDPVTSGRTAAEHLRHREKHWTIPDEQVHLMVQCMEAWFLADKDALARYYGDGFKASALPGNLKIEEIPKLDVMSGLAAATKATNKGSYHKTRHGFDLPERIDPFLVTRASPHADALIKAIGAKLQ